MDFNLNNDGPFSLPEAIFMAAFLLIALVIFLGVLIWICTGGAV